VWQEGGCGLLEKRAVDLHRYLEDGQRQSCCLHWPAAGADNDEHLDRRRRRRSESANKVRRRSTE
jgi:hypothetical protein